MTPRVVALTYEGEAFCSGSLIAPDVVLTAAHCLDPEINPLPFEKFEVFFGNDVAGRGVFVGVVDGGPNPKFKHEDPNFEYHDIGMLRLAEDAPVAPIPLYTETLPNSFIGTTVREVGFGITSLDADDAGIKREGTSEVIKFRGTLFRVDPAPSTLCSGDSGGPSFSSIDGEEKIVGVHMGGDCETFAANQRIDLELEEFIQPFLEGSSALPCSADGYCLELCEEPDPDCPPPCATADGICAADCPVPDPDCEADPCLEDPCAEGCPEDPACDAPTPVNDTEEPVADDGCAVAPARGSASSTSWLALVLAALVSSWRRALWRRGPRAKSGRWMSTRISRR